MIISVNFFNTSFSPGQIRDRFCSLYTNFAESYRVLCFDFTCSAINHCTTVLNKGRENLTRLGTYIFTNNELIAPESAITQFDDLAEIRDLTKGERVSATEMIKKLFPLMRQKMKILEDLVKSKMPEDFMETYFNLR
jgi:hypothetical protein